MVEFKEFTRRLGKLPAFINKIVKRNETLIVEMQKAQQHEGVNKEGGQMQSGYSTGYAKRRRKSGLQTSYVDLHFTGKMHKGLKVQPVKGGVDVRSKEPYEYYVRGNFPKSFGLTEPNAELLADKLAVEIEKFLVG